MARNEEKALTLFNRWQTFRKEFHTDSSNIRPLLATDCTSIVDAEKFRSEIVRDLSKKIAAIQNATLGEHRIRELNDDINKLLKQKFYWDLRIRELGGSASKGVQFYEIEGKELPGVPGYKYFGAAKDLPGVRELFQEFHDEIETRKQKKFRGDIYKNITPDYFGFRDEDDGILVEKEAKREKELQDAMLMEYRRKKQAMYDMDTIEVTVGEN